MHDREATKPPHPFHPEHRHVLNEEQRYRWLPPAPFLEAAGIAAGETVVEVGAGTGFWILPLARLVGPAGRVFAVDTEPVMLGDLRALAERERLENVEVVPSEELRIPLPDGIADTVFLAFVLHHPSDPALFLRELARLLKPGGRLIEVDWHKKQTEHGPPPEMRLSEEETGELLAAAGFTVTPLSVPNDDIYAMVGYSAR